jgi:hypothetical protein
MGESTRKAWDRNTEVYNWRLFNNALFPVHKLLVYTSGKKIVLPGCPRKT